MKTIKQALLSKASSSLTAVEDGIIEIILIDRQLDADAEYTAEIGMSSQFNGAYADYLYSLVERSNFSESGISISLADRDLILKKANAIYREIGEPEKNLATPRVFIGW